MRFSSILFSIAVIVFLTAGCQTKVDDSTPPPAGQLESREDVAPEPTPEGAPAVTTPSEGEAPATEGEAPATAGSSDVARYSDRTMSSYSRPVEWSEISVSSHTCAVGGDHSLWCWGDNSRGEVGTGRCNSSGEPSPVRVGADTNWKQVTVGDMHTCAIRTDGTLWCWGNNQFGQMGTGDTSLYAYCVNPNPRQTVPADRNDWTDVSAGGFHTCGIAGGKLYCWGSNGSFQLGISGFSQVTSPIEVKPGTKWISVSAGMDHTCAIATNDTLWCWGSNDKLQIGARIGAEDVISAPLEISDGSYIFVDAGSRHTCAVTYDRKMMCGGDMGMVRQFPVQVWDEANWASVSTCGLFACGIRTDKTLWCWNDYFGAKIGGVEWLSVDTGAGTTCAIKTNGTLWCWGRNQFGRIGDGTTSDRLLPVRISRP